MIVYDIETGPLPSDEIEQLFVPPPKPTDFDEKAVKLGNLKDQAKIREKIEAARTKWVADVADWQRVLYEAREKFFSEAALSPVTGRVLAIGVKTEKGSAVFGEDEGFDEAAILETWWDFYRHKRSTEAADFVGYCSNFFDFPFLVWRSYKFGLVLPSGLWARGWRYPGPQWLDLIDLLPKRGFAEQSRKLDDICRWLGLGGKPDGTDGGQFAALWCGSVDQRQQAVAYLHNDLDLTWRLAERMGVIA